ncbi:MAG TPA: hypothetical protein VM434_18915, partial [Beijerinckiaceae bacterium]|nr:hypothetical protein [Beijerinckiaceae bacterium]
LEAILRELEIMIGSGTAYDRQRIVFHCALAALSPNPILSAWVRELWSAHAEQDWEPYRRALAGAKERRREVHLLRRQVKALERGGAGRWARSYFQFLGGTWFPFRPLVGREAALPAQS